jgi:hypothetical protein
MVYRYGAGGKQYEVSREQYFTLRNTPKEQRISKLIEWGYITPEVPTREDVIAQQQQAEAEAEKIRKLEWIKQQEEKGAILSKTLKEKVEKVRWIEKQAAKGSILSPSLIAQAPRRNILTAGTQPTPKAEEPPKILAGKETSVSPGIAYKTGLISKTEYESVKNDPAVFYIVNKEDVRTASAWKEKWKEADIPEDKRAADIYYRLEEGEYYKQKAQQPGNLLYPTEAERIKTSTEKAEAISEGFFQKIGLGKNAAGEVPLNKVFLRTAVETFPVQPSAIVKSWNLGDIFGQAISHRIQSVREDPLNFFREDPIMKAGREELWRKIKELPGYVKKNPQRVAGTLAGALVWPTVIATGRGIQYIQAKREITPESIEAGLVSTQKGKTVERAGVKGLDVDIATGRENVAFLRKGETIATGKINTYQTSELIPSEKAAIETIQGKIRVTPTGEGEPTEAVVEGIGYSKQNPLHPKFTDVKISGGAATQEEVNVLGLKWFRIKGEPVDITGAAAKTTQPIITTFDDFGRTGNKFYPQTPPGNQPAITIPTGSIESVIKSTTSEGTSLSHAFQITPPAEAPPPTDIIRNLMRPTKSFTALVEGTVGETSTSSIGGILTSKVIPSLARSQVVKSAWNPMQLAPAELVLTGATPEITKRPPVISNVGAFFSRVGTPQPKYVYDTRVISKQRELTREEQEAEMMKAMGIGAVKTRVGEKERSRSGTGGGLIFAPPQQQQQQKQQQALQTALRYNVATQQRTRVTGVGKVGKVYPGRVPGRVIRPEFELEGLMFGKRKFRPGFYRYFERNWPVATTPEEISMAFGFGKKKKKR